MLFEQLSEKSKDFKVLKNKITLHCLGKIVITKV